MTVNKRILIHNIQPNISNEMLDRESHARSHAYTQLIYVDCLDPFQYEVVAVVANDAHINSVHDLRGSRLCHPGHGLSRHWTDIMANVSHKNLIKFKTERQFGLKSQ